MNERYAREQLADYCRMLYDRNLTVSAGGNMSVRINDREVIITPSGRNKGLLEPEDMVKISIDGVPLSAGESAFLPFVRRRCALSGNGRLVLILPPSPAK